MLVLQRENISVAVEKWHYLGKTGSVPIINYYVLKLYSNTGTGNEWTYVRYIPVL